LLIKKSQIYHFLEESYKFINWIVDNNNILNSSDDLAEKIIEYHYSNDSNYISTFYGNTEDKNIDKKYILPFVIEMIKSAGNVYKSEQEIYLNNKTLNIPSDSQLFFKNEKDQKSNLSELIDKYKLREKYSVYFVKHQDIQKYSSLASQQRTNKKQEKFNSERKELEIKKDAVVHELLYLFLGESLKSFKEIIEKEIAEYSDSTLFYYDYDEERKEIDWYGIILVQLIVNKYIEIIQNNWKEFVATKDVKDITIHSFYDFQNNSNRELIKYFEENKSELEKINDYHNINGNWLSEYRIEYWLKKSVDDYQDMPEWIDYKELSKMYLEKMDAQMYRYYSEQEIPLFSKYNEGGSVSVSVKLINERVKCINENLKNKLSEYENQNQYDDLWFEMRTIIRKLDGYLESGKFGMSRDEFKEFKNSFFPLDDDKYRYQRGEEVTQQFPNLMKLNIKIWRTKGDSVIYRGVSIQDWVRIQKQGYIDSDMRSAITEYEGINLGQTIEVASSYLPINNDGVILAINPKGLDMYILTDDYIRLFEPIPIENVIKVSDVVSKDKLGAILSPNTNEKLNEIEDWLKLNSINVKCNPDIIFKDGGNVNEKEFVIQELDKDYKELYQVRGYKNIGGDVFFFSRLRYSEKDVFIIELSSGKEIGRATLDEKEKYLINIRIDENYRRKGLALSLYNFIEYVTGEKLKPSPIKISNEAKKLWMKRNPDIILNDGGETEEINLIKNNTMNTNNPKDTITMDVPLLIRFAELMREDIKTDVALHEVVENLLDIKDKGILTMNDYESIVGNITGTEENITEEPKMEEGGKVKSIHSQKGDIMVSLDDNWYSDDSSVELVPVTELIKFREYDRKVNPKYNQDNSRDNINHLKFMFQKEGVKSPLIIEYSAEDNAVLIIEGNHRLNSAIDLGMEYLPARVVLKKYGKYSPVKIKNAMKVDGIKANSSNYIPSDLKPSYVGITGAKPIAYAEGGIIEGRLHSECGDDGCGRKFQVGENGHIIEAERDEAVIVADAFNETKEMTIEGTPSEIASALNVIGGGKNFDSGAKIVDGGKEKELPEMKKEATDTDVDDVIDSGSIIINRRSMADEKSYKVTGSAKQIASAINSINGNGVVIEQGAKIE
jgi:hypothetical protein